MCRRAFTSLPTDTTAFYLKEIPSINFFTGSHEDYHRPTDTAATLNYEGLERITHFACALASDLTGAVTRPDFVKVERSSPSGMRENLRVYLGSIPDYTSEISGVKLTGVRGDSPADRAGLQAGDVIGRICRTEDYEHLRLHARFGLSLNRPTSQSRRPAGRPAADSQYHSRS